MDSNKEDKQLGAAPGPNNSAKRVTQTFTIKIGTGKHDKGADSRSDRRSTVLRTGPSGSPGKSWQTEHSIVDSEHRDLKQAKISSRHGG